MGITGKRCWVIPSFRPSEVTVNTRTRPPYRAVVNHTDDSDITLSGGSERHWRGLRLPECKTHRASCAIFLVPSWPGRSGLLSRALSCES